MTKEAAINAMEQGGYKVAHRFFSEGEYIWSADEDYFMDEEGLWLPKKDFLGVSSRKGMGNRLENCRLKINKVINNVSSLKCLEKYVWTGVRCPSPPQLIIRSHANQAETER